MRNKNKAIAILLAALVFCGYGPCHAQTKSKEDNTPSDQGKWRVEAQWIAEVIGNGGMVVKTLGAFNNYQDAEDACRAWSVKHPNDLRLAVPRETKVKVRDLPPLSSKPQRDDSELSGPLPPKAKIGETKEKREAKRYDAKLVGKWIDKNGQGEFVLEKNGVVKWTSKDRAKTRIGSWFVRDDGSVLINVARGWIDFVGTADGGTIAGKYANQLAPHWGFKPLALERELDIEALREKYTEKAESHTVAGSTWDSTRSSFAFVFRDMGKGVTIFKNAEDGTFTWTENGHEIKIIWSDGSSSTFTRKGDVLSSPDFVDHVRRE